MTHKKTMHKKKQKVPVPQPEVDPLDDGFDAMMSALDWYFHVSRCREHTGTERAEAFHAAYVSFIEFTNGDLAMDAEANAPTSGAIH
jgi:hypothetical protein